MTDTCAAGKLVAVAVLLLAAGSADALPMDLATAERIAVGRSADLRSLENQAATTACALALGVRDWLPQLSLGYLDSSNIVTGGPDSSSIQWTATLRQPLFDGGRSRRRRRIAEADLELQGRAIKDKKREILESVDSAYNRILMLKRKIAVQKETLTIADKELEIARAQFGLGGMREVDLLQSELERSSLEISTMSSEAGLEEGGFALRQLLGLRPETPLELADDFDSGYKGMELPEGARAIEALVLEGNLELRQRQAELCRRLAALAEASEWYLPNVSFEGSLSLSGGRYPLQGASVNGKIVFEIPAPTSPIGFSVSTGSSTGNQRASGSSADISPLKETTSFAENGAAAKESALLRQRLDDMAEALAFQARKGVAAYNRDRTSLDLRRRDLALRRKTAEIQKRLLDIGELTRVDYLKTLNKTAEGESAILEPALALRKSERALERLLGLEAGGLGRVCHYIAAGRD